MDYDADFHDLYIIYYHLNDLDHNLFQFKETRKIKSILLIILFWQFCSMFFFITPDNPRNKIHVIRSVVNREDTKVYIYLIVFIPAINRGIPSLISANDIGPFLSDNFYYLIDNTVTIIYIPHRMKNGFNI